MGYRYTVCSFESENSKQANATIRLRSHRDRHLLAIDPNLG